MELCMMVGCLQFAIYCRKRIGKLDNVKMMAINIKSELNFKIEMKIVNEL